MDAHVIQKICEAVYAQFPDFQGSRPKVSAYSGENSLLIFEKRASTANGKTLQRTVRVISDPGGKILKMTTSR